MKFTKLVILPVTSFFIAAVAVPLFAQTVGTGVLDFEFFKAKVQPIFLATRPGHARCVACHAANNSALRLQPFSHGSTTWNEEESRKNFDAVHKISMSEG
jgi:hypothetical protein